MTPDKISIDAAKHLYSLPWISPELKLALENDFPELKESENGERVRKSLVKFFGKFKPQDMWDETVSFGDVLAYLERQEEQKPTHVPKFKVGDDIKYRGDIYEITTIETNNNGSFYYVSVIGTPSDPDDVKTCIGPAGEKDIRLLSSQSHWKPSKDEITAIEVAVKYLLAHTSDEQLCKNVISVFEHLKQL